MLFSLGASGCQSGAAPETSETTAPLTVTHTFDFASQMPSRLAIMYSMSWFGLPSTEPSNPVPDPSYMNWGASSTCSGVSAGTITAPNPASCTTDYTGADERNISSRYRPLAGIYSAWGRTPEALRRIDLMLSNVRRSCDAGARLDAWSVQLSGLIKSSLHSASPSSSEEVNYQTLLHFLSEADAAGMSNVIMPGEDASWYFHFPGAVGLSCTVNQAHCPAALDALASDIVDMLGIV
ncbi:MAG TPA: hypothetical protein VII38_19200, partial [Polyangia bacterium]